MVQDCHGCQTLVTCSTEKWGKSGDKACRVVHGLSLSLDVQSCTMLPNLILTPIKNKDIHGSPGRLSQGREEFAPGDDSL